MEFLGTLMAAQQPRPDPKVELVSLILQAKALEAECAAAFKQHKGSSAIGRALGEIGVDAAYDRLGIPKNVSRSALQSFLRSWETTPEYQVIRRRFEELLQRVAAFLGTISEAVPSLRPPGNSRKLLAWLRPVHDAAQLDTKLRRLVAVLEGLQTLTLVLNQDIPAPRPRRRPSRQRTALQAAAPHAGEAWSLLGIAVTVFVASLTLLQSLGWMEDVAAALGATAVVVLALLATRKWWLPVLGRVLSRR